MSSEHWFDAVARPHTRRATLKAGAVLAGALLTGGALRPRLAWGTEREPCFVPCVEAARTAWGKTLDGCNTSSISLYAQGNLGLAYGSVPLAAVLMFAAGAYGRGCVSSAELTWHRSTLACRASECGNPEKYPGGTVPPPPKKPPVCDPAAEKVCGDICCRTFVDCCFSKSKQAYVCYAAGHNCEGA